MMERMPQTRMTISIDDAVARTVKTTAEAEGVTVSAFIERAARDAALTQATRAYHEWLDNAPDDVREELAAWDRLSAEADAETMREIAALENAA